jgi:hypothetical protein
MKFILGLIIGALAGFGGNFFLDAAEPTLNRFFRSLLRLDLAAWLTPSVLGLLYLLFLAVLFIVDRKAKIERFALGVMTAFPAPIVLIAYLAAKHYLD